MLIHHKQVNLLILSLQQLLQHFFNCKMAKETQIHNKQLQLKGNFIQMERKRQHSILHKE